MIYVPEKVSLSSSRKRLPWKSKKASGEPSRSTNLLQMGKGLLPEAKEKLKDFLCRNLDVFLWRHKDMVGIDPMVSLSRPKNHV